MSLEKQTFSVPLNAEVNSKVDEKLTNESIFLAQENVRFKKIGTVIKRNGYAPINQTINDNRGDFFNPEFILSDSEEILIAGEQGREVAYYANQNGLVPAIQQNEFSTAYNTVGATPCGLDIKGSIKTEGYTGTLDSDYNHELDLIATVYNSGDIATLSIFDNKNKTSFSSDLGTVVVSTINNQTFSTRFFSNDNGNFLLVVNARPTDDSFFRVYDLSDYSITASGAITTPEDPEKVDIALRDNECWVFLAQRGTPHKVSVRTIDETGVTATYSNNIDLSVDHRGTSFIVGGISAVKAPDTSGEFNFYYVYQNESLGITALHVNTSAVTSFRTGLTVSESLYVGAEIIDSTQSSLRMAIVFAMANGSYFGVWRVGVDSVSPATIPKVEKLGLGAPVTRLTKTKENLLHMIQRVSYKAPEDTASASINFSRLVVYSFDFEASLNLRNALPTSTNENDWLSTGSVSAFYFSSSNSMSSYNCGTHNNKIYVPSYKEVGFRSGGSVFSSGDRASLGVIGLIELDFSNDKSKNIQKSKLGRSYYTNGGQVMVSDSQTFIPLPWQLGFNLIAVSSGSGSGFSAGTYHFRAVAEFVSAKGETYLSQPSSVSSVTLGSSSNINISFRLLRTMLLRKDIKASFILYSSNSASGPFNYYKKIPFPDFSGFSYIEVIDDESIVGASDRELIYTTGGVLANDPIPPSRFTCSHQERLFVVDADEFDLISYSKKKKNNFGVEFSDFQKIVVSSSNLVKQEKIKALASMHDKLIIFKEFSIWYVFGAGPNDLGAGGSFSNPELISSELGVLSIKSVIQTPLGVMFQSVKGIYLLDGGLNLTYIGSAVEEFNGDQITGSLVVERDNYVLFNQGNRVLAYDYLLNRWSVDTISLDDMTHIGGKNIILKDGVIYRESDNHSDPGNTSIVMKVKTGWFKVSNIQDFGRFWRVQVLGKFKSDHALKVKAYYDYDNSNFDEYTFDPSSSDDIYQYEIHLKRQKCQSVRFEIFDVPESQGESMELTDLSLIVGLKKGLNKINKNRKR